MAKGSAELLLKVKTAGQQALAKVKDGIKAIGAAALVAAAATVAFVAKSVGAYKVQEAAVNKLNQSLVQQGIFTADLSKKYQENAAALQKLTTFGDEAIISAQAQLQSYLGQTEVTQEVTKATLDFASAMGVDLKTAADLIGKTVGSSTNALSRYGIEVDTSGTKTEKLAAVTAALNDKFGGQSEAAAKGLGALDQLSNSVGDLFEKFGQEFAPVIGFVSKRLLGLSEAAQQSGGFISSIGDIFRFVTGMGLRLKTMFTNLGETIGTVFGTIVEASTQAISLNFDKAREAVNIGMEAIAEDTKANQAQLDADLAELEATNKDAKLQKDEEFARLEQSSRIRNEQIKGKNQKGANAKTLQGQKKFHDGLLLLGVKKDKAEVANMQSTFGTISSLTQSNNKGLVALGRSAAIANITLSTSEGIARALGAFPPPINFVMASLVGAAGAVQIAAASGVKLAEGGIVQPRTGGVAATIAEAGQPEAVIPLDDDGVGASLGNISITFTGPVLGDDDQAREFAIVLDQQLRTLRQNNESEGFDERIT